LIDVRNDFFTAPPSQMLRRARKGAKAQSLKGKVSTLQVLQIRVQSLNGGKKDYAR
jgi:hypothetical protein